MQKYTFNKSIDNHDANRVKNQYQWQTTKYCNDKQHGFTLIELMIALLLGSLVAAAAIQVFYISQRTSTTQRSASAVQDSAVFGLNLLEQHLKLTNLNYDGNSRMTDKTPGGGIILSATNAPAKLSATTDADKYTRQAVATASTFTSASSDQLTIQFTVPQKMTDCENTTVNASTATTKVQLIQRYYLKDGGLYCDSDLTGNFGGADDGVEIISNVDQFRVLLLTENGFKTPNDYTTGTAIYGVKLGFVFSGATPTLDAADAAPSLFGAQLTLADGATNTVRRVYEPTILFRNARL